MRLNAIKNAILPKMTGKTSVYLSQNFSVKVREKLWLPANSYLKVKIQSLFSAHPKRDFENDGNFLDIKNYNLVLK